MRVNIMKVASLSFAFYSAAVDGNAELVHHFDDALHGYTKDVILLGDAPVRMYDDECISLVWDTAALMLEEDDELPRYAQYAYDEVGLHTKYAYKLPLVEKVVSAPRRREVKNTDNVKVAYPKVNQEAGHVETMCSLAEIIDYAESLAPEQMGAVDAIQKMLLKKYARICSDSEFERISQIDVRVASKAGMHVDSIGTWVDNRGNYINKVEHFEQNKRR